MKNFLFILVCIMCVSTLAQAQTWKEIYDKGDEFYNQKDYKNAVIYYEKALPLAEKEFGKESKTYATTLNDAGLCYDKQGLYAKAEQFFLTSKNIFEKLLGKESEDFINLCNNLIALYLKQDLYAKAEPLYLELKNIYENTTGKQTKDYCIICNNLEIGRAHV